MFALAKTLAVSSGLFLALSLGTPDLAPLVGENLAAPLQFASLAEAAPRHVGGAGRPGHAAVRPGHGAGGVGRPGHVVGGVGRPGHGVGGVGRPGYGVGGVGRPGYGRPGYGRPGYGVVRPYPRVRPAYWGRVYAGVTLGTILYVTAIPPAPAPDLCWYWTNNYQNQGYWDYCNPPGY